MSDRQMIDAVKPDGRASLTELSNELHLGVSATRARLHGLEQGGVITGYTARVDPAACGFALRGVVRMKLRGALYDKGGRRPGQAPADRALPASDRRSLLCRGDRRVDMADLESITSDLARVGSISTDLVYEVVVDRPIPVASTPSARSVKIG
jgi:Lrp/AsnC family leucine-responsive transcriptional regulator